MNHEISVTYSGGKTTSMIDNLAPRHPHKFRLKVILQGSAVPTLAEKAVTYYGDEQTVYEKIKDIPYKAKKDASPNEKATHNRAKEMVTENDVDVKKNTNLINR